MQHKFRLVCWWFCWFKHHDHQVATVGPLSKTLNASIAQNGVLFIIVKSNKYSCILKRCLCCEVLLHRYWMENAREPLVHFFCVWVCVLKGDEMKIMCWMCLSKLCFEFSDSHTSLRHSPHVPVFVLNYALNPLFFPEITTMHSPFHNIKPSSRNLRQILSLLWTVACSNKIKWIIS